MWRSLLALLAEARRPLVVVDFETAGLGGKPPVEFAVLIWAPWRAPEDDEVTRSIRDQVPPGLTYACVQRLDPLCPIEPGATRVHGIRDEDVRGGTPFNDLEVRGFFAALADGDASESEGPAIWVGHNCEEADLPWARRWGYLPQAEVDAIDTLRLARRLVDEHPRPLAVDLSSMTPLGGVVYTSPVVTDGLDCYSQKVCGLHLALFGQRPEVEHGALADCASTSRILCRMLDLWSPLWPPRRSDLPASANLTALLVYLDVTPPYRVSWDGWLAHAEAGEGLVVSGPGGFQFVWRRGKHKGKPTTCDPSYAQWVASLPRLPTGIDGEAWCSRHTADILKGNR